MEPRPYNRHSPPVEGGPSIDGGVVFPLCSPVFIQHIVGVVFTRHKSKKVLKKVDFFRFFLLTYDVGGLYNLGHDSGAKWVAVSQSGRISPRS